MKTLKALCMDKVIKHKINFFERLPLELEGKLNTMSKLKQMSISELLEAAKDEHVAQHMLADPAILNKLGYFDKNTKQSFVSYASSYFIKYDKEFYQGRYLYEFLTLHQSVWVEAKQMPEIVSKLSEYQQGAIEAHFNGTSKQFILRN